MKKCMKILAAAGGVFAGVGLIFLIAGLILSGGSIDWEDVFSINGKDLLKYNIRLGDDKEAQEWDEDFFEDSGDWKCTTVSGVRNLDIEMAVGDLQIREKILRCTLISLTAGRKLTRMGMNWRFG